MLYPALLFPSIFYEHRAFQNFRLVLYSEVADYCYEEMEEIKWAINGKPAKFTAWFRLAFPTIETWWQQQYGGIEAQKI